MTEDDARQFSESLVQIGQGWYKQIALAFKLEIPETLGLSRREWAEKFHGYVKLAIPERREAVAELAADGMSQREIADALGVDQATVSRDLKPDANASGMSEDVASDVVNHEPGDADASLDPAPHRVPTPEELEARTKALPDDLELRVRNGHMGLAEAEAVVVERQARVAGWAENLRDALRRLARMVGNPIPTELAAALGPRETAIVQKVIKQLEGEDCGFLI